MRVHRHGQCAVRLPAVAQGSAIGQRHLQRALDRLMEFLPSRNWFDKASAEHSYPD